MRLTGRRIAVLSGAGVLLLTVALSQFVALELSLGKLYLGLSCFGPYGGWSTLRPHIGLLASPVLRPLSISTLLTGVWGQRSRLGGFVSIPWWLVAGTLAPVLVLLARRQARAPGQPFPVERAA